ncbi:hypothetical protein Ccrd_004756 [Cynara cardunculus var. scolymus]|uniref:Uncharacterized protein n=1 Tax=Cynara cardunculus var. scolymus TaxID=59895 RepID=A0A124SCA4_CYNCS|nr:hypothetical protein Ccrd_004756 [Cynara cardunculus var. scolymus]
MWTPRFLDQSHKIGNSWWMQPRSITESRQTPSDWCLLFSNNEAWLPNLSDAILLDAMAMEVGEEIEIGNQGSKKNLLVEGEGRDTLEDGNGIKVYYARTLIES